MSDDKREMNLVVSPPAAFEALVEREGVPAINITGDYRSVIIGKDIKTMIVEVDHPDIPTAFPVEPGSELYNELIKAESPINLR